MRASERARARERERWGVIIIEIGLIGPYAVQALHRRRGGLPARALLRRRARARLLLSLRQRERLEASLGSQQIGDESGRVRLCLYLISLWRPRCRSRRRAALRLLFGRHLSAAIKPSERYRALGRQRRHNFWPEGGEVRKFGLAIMAADYYINGRGVAARSTRGERQMGPSRTARARGMSDTAERSASSSYVRRRTLSPDSLLDLDAVRAFAAANSLRDTDVKSVSRAAVR